MDPICGNVEACHEILSELSFPAFPRAVAVLLKWNSFGEYTKVLIFRRKFLTSKQVETITNQICIISNTVACYVTAFLLAKCYLLLYSKHIDWKEFKLHSSVEPQFCTVVEVSSSCSALWYLTCNLLLIYLKKT